MMTSHTSFLLPGRWQALAAMLLCLVAFGLSALVSRSVFEHLPHLEDEVAYLYQARVFAAGEWVIPAPPIRQAFVQPFVVDDAGSGEMRRFSKYTPGWSLTLAVGIAMGQGWWVNAALAALAVALVFRLGASVFNADVGLIAALLLTFSPAALLLNGSLMAHSAALAEASGFIFAVWRMEQAQPRIRWRWALLAGVLLGIMLITRPAPTVAVALPFATWALIRALVILERREGFRVRVRDVMQYLLPYMLLAVVTLSFQSINYAYSYAATGNARANLYTLVWPYDRIGFGECCGRSGHTLEKAVRHVRFDMSVAAADLFGWQLNGWEGQDIPPDLVDHLLAQADYWNPIGLSFVLLPFGIIGGLLWVRRRPAWESAGLVVVWGIAVIAWSMLPVVRLPLEVVRHPLSSWLWIILGLLTMLISLLVAVRSRSRQVHFTWLLVSFIGCIVIFQMTYWVGAQRYSARYWYEAIGAICLLSAIPLAALMRTQWLRGAIYVILLAGVGYAHYNYAIPRVSVLHQFNNVMQAHVDELLARRTDDRPILLLVTGPSTGDYRISWRAYGSFSAMTSPFLDSDIVAARLTEGDTNRRAQLLAMFPDRQVIEMRARAAEATFVD